jgi:hypothetical protein
MAIFSFLAILFLVLNPATSMGETAPVAPSGIIKSPFSIYALSGYLFLIVS